MTEWQELAEYDLPEWDLYHPHHPFHHLVLEEIEEYDVAMVLAAEWYKA